MPTPIWPLPIYLPDIHRPNIADSYAALFFQHRTLLPSPVISTTGCCFHFGSVSSFFLESFLFSSPVAYWAPTDRGSSSFSVVSFCLFIQLMGFSWQLYWIGLQFPLPVHHILSELSTVSGGDMHPCGDIWLICLRWPCRAWLIASLSYASPFNHNKALRCRAMQEIRIQSLGLGNPLEKEMTTHSSFLAWEIPWTEEPGGLQSRGLKKSWTWLSMHTHITWTVTFLSSYITIELKYIIVYLGQ